MASLLQHPCSSLGQLCVRIRPCSVHTLMHQDRAMGLVSIPLAMVNVFIYAEMMKIHFTMDK